MAALSAMTMLREKVVMVMADGCKLTLPDMSLEQVNLKITSSQAPSYARRLQSETLPSNSLTHRGKV